MKKIIQIKMVAAAVVIFLVGGLAISQAKTVGQRTLELVRANKGLSISTNEVAGSVAEVSDDVADTADVFAEAVETPDVSAKPVATKVFRKTRSAIIATDDKILNLIPKDALFCVIINDLDSSLGNLDKYIAGMSPIPLSLQMMAKMQIGGLLGDPMFANIRSNAGFAAFGVPNPNMPMPNYAVMVPVKSFDDFVSNNAQAQGPDAAGIVTMTTQLPIGNLLAVSAGNGKYALLTDESQKDAILSIRDSLGKNAIAKTLNAAEVERATTESIWAYCNVEQVNSVYGQMIEMLMEQAKAQMPDMEELAAASGNPAMQMGDPAAAMDMYFEFFNKMLNEAKSVSIAATPQPTALNLTVSFEAKPETELASLLTTEDMADGFALAGYLDGKDAMNMLIKFDKSVYEKMAKLSIEMMSGIMTDDQDEFTNDWSEIIAGISKSIGNEQVASMSFVAEKPHFAITQIFRVNDTERMRQEITKSLALTNDLYRSIGTPSTISYEKDVDSYKGAKIDKISVTVKVAAGTPDAAQAQQMIENMYGSNIEYYMAYTKDKVLIVMGPDSEEGIKDLIDKTSKPASTRTSGDLKKAFTIMPKAETSDFVCTVNVIKMFGNISEILSSLPAPMNMAGAMLDGIKMDSKSCLVTAGKIEDGSANVYITLPKEHLADIVNVGMQVQAKIMQGMQMDMGEMGKIKMKMGDAEEMDIDDFETDDFDETEIVEL